MTPDHEEKTMQTAMPTTWNDVMIARAPNAIAPVIPLPLGRNGQAAPAARAKPGCAACAMRRVCVTSELGSAGLDKFEDHLHSKRRIKAGDRLYRSGDLATSLYTVRSGFIMTSTVARDGREQVTGFHVLGDVIGIDMIGGGRHSSDAVALEDTEVCELALSSVETLADEIPEVRRRLYRLIGDQFHYERESMLLLGTMRAEERVASFLLNLGRRYESRGFSAKRFVLRMTRADIGSYLGLRLETVSRLFSRFQAEGLLHVENKSIEILNPEGLNLVIGSSVN
jgi:CRP/FNR family transcriptional regulator